MERPAFQFYPGDWLPVIIDPDTVPQIPKALTFPGVYLWVSDTGEPLYIGESKNVQKRLKAHFRFSTRHGMAYTFDGVIPAGRPVVWVLRVDDIHDRLRCEAAGIAALRPRYNTAVSGVWRPES